MVSREEALRIAAEHVESTYHGEGTHVMNPELTQEYQTLWAVVFNARDRPPTGDMTNAPFPHALLVPKDGSPPWGRPTAWSTDEFERRFGKPL